MASAGRIGEGGLANGTRVGGFGVDAAGGSVCAGDIVGCSAGAEEGARRAGEIEPSVGPLGVAAAGGCAILL